MTLDEERRMLAVVLSYADDPTALVGGGELDVAHLDQVRAAAREVDSMVTRIAEDGNAFFGPVAAHHDGPVTDPELARDFAMHLLAAVMRCVHHCEHASAGGRPLYGFLAARVVSCADCLPAFYPRVAESDARAKEGGDRLCDLCLREAEWFKPAQIAFGPSMLVGDLCGGCVGKAEAAIA